MDGQTDVGHINLIGGLVTRNPLKNESIWLGLSLAVLAVVFIGWQHFSTLTLVWSDG